MKRKFIYLLLSIAALITLALCDHSEKTESIAKYQERIDSLSSIESRYSIQIEQYRIKSDSLEKRKLEISSDLKKEKQYAESLKAKLNQILNKNRKDLSFQDKDILCDTLRDQATAYVHETEIKDSLEEIQIATLENIIIVKDKALNDCRKTYDVTKQTLQESILDSKECFTQLSAYKRQIRKEKIKNILLTTGAIILSTVTVTTLITHK